jgi:hypothetical protein
LVWRGATPVEIPVKKMEVSGKVESLGILRCAQDDGKNCNGNNNGNQVHRQPGQLQLIANPGRHDRNLGVPEVGKIG